MKKSPGKFCLLCIWATSALLLAGCATPAPQEFGGHWAHVNRFSAATQRIPLQRSYAYFASPLDATLKTLLERWARDTRMRVDYRAGDDFTLHTPVSGIHTPDVRAAAARLNEIYAQEGVTVTVSGSAFVVENASPAIPGQANPDPTAAQPSGQAVAGSRGTKSDDGE